MVLKVLLVIEISGALSYLINTTFYQKPPCFDMTSYECEHVSAELSGWINLSEDFFLMYFFSKTLPQGYS